MKALRDTVILFGRSMRHIQRSPDTIITVAIMPIMFMLLFVYVFGGAIDAGTDNYVDYMLPGILLIAIATGISYTAVRIFTDTQNGHRRTVPLHARRTLIGALGARADLAGVQRDHRWPSSSWSPWSWASGPART